MFGERAFKTLSDAGAVKVGNQEFSVLFNNGIGDGVNRVAIFNKVEAGTIFNSSMMNFISSVNGEFYIYDYDCGDTPAIKDGTEVKLKGKYFVYSYEGLIAFVQFQTDIN